MSWAIFRFFATATIVGLSIVGAVILASEGEWFAFALVLLVATLATFWQWDDRERANL